ncbi:restriction endonuclease subunit M [Marinobacter sp. R17]|uniref:restriction endonuclease subunit S n=1 Tax=Marinobacter sp. R17 TaxID=2484250 RepID=UPI000F4B3214|nr:restriction endonuclease subunit S [Marinobacter sp. R17]ROT96190.1 restriction endonuclease subunit M [Marinobacter sp. R17]
MSFSWPVKKLDDLCNIARGGSPRPIKQYLTEEPDGVNWIKISDATASSKYIFETKQKIKPEGIKRSRMVHEGDFILSNSMSFGRPYIMRTSGCIHDGWLVLGEISADLNQDFLYLFLGSPNAYKQFDERAAGSTVRNLNIDLVRSVTVPIPPLAEQKRIVAILDEAFAGIDAAIANTEKNLANARELFESYLNSVFGERSNGWEVKAVREFANHCLGKMLDKQKNKGTLRPYLRNQNVQWFSVDTSDVLEMKIEEHEEPRYRVQKGDLLVCEGGYPGRAAIWTESEPVFFQKALHRVRCEETIFNEWLLYFLYWADLSGELKQYFTGAGIQHFTGKSLGRLQVPLPPKVDAEYWVLKFGELHEKVQGVEMLYQQKLNALVELKQSLLQKAFSGELKIRSAEKETEEAVA